jgi:hypothetical protein
MEPDYLRLVKEQPNAPLRLGISLYLQGFLDGKREDGGVHSSEEFAALNLENMVDECTAAVLKRRCALAKADAEQVSIDAIVERVLQSSYRAEEM